MSRAVGLSLAVLTLGLVLRVIDGPWVVLGGTFVACAGIAVSNVLIPVVVKDSFPTRVGLLTGVYTAALALGAALAAAATPRLEEFLGSWRGAVGAWALLSAAALVVWFAGARHGAPTRTSNVRAGGSSGSTRIWRSPLAWVITVFFGLQSLFAYTVMGWLPAMLTDAGVDRNTAGLLLAVSMLLSVPVSLIVPPMAARQRSQSVMVLLLGVLSAAGVAGLLLAPTLVPALWVVLIGLGMGMFPLALLIISLRTRSTSDTAQLSSMAQSIGYLIAATGPFAFGVLREATGAWTGALAVQLVLLGALTACGVVAGRPRYV